MLQPVQWLSRNGDWELALRTKQMVDQKWSRELSKLFSASIVNELVKNGSSSFVHEIVFASGLDKHIGNKATIRDLFQWVFDHLCQNYRNEYIYKSAIARQILLSKHSLKEAMLLTELRVGSCKADVVILNGTSTVYEIKSEYDNMDRLALQLATYRKVFDKIQVITAPSQLEKVMKQVEADIGIMLLDDDGEITPVRDAMSCRSGVSPDVIFDSFRKPEYTSIIKAKFGRVPEVPNTQIYSACKKLFASLSPEEAHDLMVAQLKGRSNKALLQEFLDSIPECFHAYCLSSGMKERDGARFVEVLNAECKSVFCAA